MERAWNNFFSSSITVPVEYNTVLLVVNYVPKISWSYKDFFAQVDPLKNIAFKVSTGILSQHWILKYNRTF